MPNTQENDNFALEKAQFGYKYVPPLQRSLGQISFRNVLHGVTDSRQVLETRGMVLVRLLKTRAALHHCARLGFALNAFAFFKEWHKCKTISDAQVRVF